MASLELRLPADAPLRDDGAYAAFLEHRTDGPCTCILCLPSSFSLLLSHLEHHRCLIQRALLQQLSSSTSSSPSSRATLPFIPHACLSIDASWTDWTRATARSAWESLRPRSAHSEQLQREQLERDIQLLVNARRRDGEEEEDTAAHDSSSTSFSPFLSTAVVPHPAASATPFSSFCSPPPSPSPLLLLPPPPSEVAPSFCPFLSDSPPLEPYFVLPTLSVRSSLTLYLTLRAFPPGSSVLLTAITIPDMLTVLQHFHLTPIPIDIDPHTLTPSLTSLLTHTQPHTVALLIAHLYGKQSPLTPLISLAHSLHLEVWEDVAEGFRGFTPTPSPTSSSPLPYFAPFPLGHPQADLVLFSFGAIKCNTAFGGGLLLLPPHRSHTAAALLSLHHSLPAASASAYLTKCLKVLAGMALLNVPLLSSLTMTSSRMMRVDHKALVVSILRGFPSHLMQNLQHQPSLPLLHQLHTRLHSYTHQHTRGTVRAELMREMLHGCGLVVGHQARSRHYWLFPLMVEEADGEGEDDGLEEVNWVLAELTRLGVDAYRGATQLSVVRGGGCEQAERLMDRVIYLPVHGRVPLMQLVRMAAVVHIVWHARAQRPRGSALKRTGERIALPSRL